MKRIPIAAAERVAKQYGYDQVVIVARKVGDGGGDHVTTYGVDADNCDVAGRIGTFLKSKIMGWPDVLGTLVDRFLMWPLPKTFAPDCGVSFDRAYAEQRSINWPVGTNLLTAEEAKQMVEYLLAPTGGSRG
jgi:hypothetical protein